MINHFKAALGDELLLQLQEALDTGGNTHSLQDLIDLCLTGDAQMHHGERSVAFTEIHDHPQHRALHCWLIAGDRDELLGPMLARVEAFARANGCERLTMVGRMGWLRDKTIKDAGFSATHIAMSKSLTEKEDAHV